MDTFLKKVLEKSFTKKEIHENRNNLLRSIKGETISLKTIK